MRGKIFLVIACLALMIVSCVATKPMLVNEEGRTVAQLGDIAFALPPGFKVVQTVKKLPGEKMTDSMVFMASAQKGFSTVLVFSMQKTKQDYQFDIVDMKERYPAAVVYEPAPAVKSLSLNRKRKVPYKAASYPALQPMFNNAAPNRNLVCKCFTGFYYSGDTRRYRVDVIQNFRGKVAAPKDGKFNLSSKQTEELKAFHGYCMSLIEENLRYL